MHLLFTNIVRTSTPWEKSIALIPNKLFIRNTFNYPIRLTHVVTKKTIGVWLLTCAGMVYGAVAVGGLTRLTESGLSMVNWDLFKTMKPPFSREEWEREFENYKQYPEYKFKNETDGEMTLSKFKFIWTMEYLHRMWGRAVGLVFLIPCAYFWYCGHFSLLLKRRMLFAGALLISQGLIGWWMVKSGLDPSANSQFDIPRVSQYRLATHLLLAFVLYSIFLWNGFSSLFTPYDHSKVSSINKLRGMVYGSKFAVFSTILFGAFVAGLDAGLLYNNWPKFGNNWIPNELNDNVKLRDISENPAIVQFIHRNLAYLTLVMTTLTWIKGRRMSLSPRAKFALHTVLVASWAQAILGIFTLLHHVPISLASIHQNGALVLATSIIWLSNEIRKIPK